MGVLNTFDVKGTALVVAQSIDKNLVLASRNIANVEVTTSDALNTYQVLRPAKLIFTRGAFEKIEERLTKE